MFAFYGWKQRVGLTSNIINTAANKGVLLALVAMAQTIPVLTGGIDLSVGMVFVLTNCLGATIVIGDDLLDRPRDHRRARGRSRLRHHQRSHRRLWPAAADHRHARDQRDLSSASRCGCGRSRAARSTRIFADLMTRSTLAVPHSIVLVVLRRVLVLWIPYRRSVLGRAAYAIGSSEQAAYMSGVPIARGEDRSPTRLPACSPRSPACC